MTSFVISHDLDYLRNQICDRLDVYPLQDWDAPLLVAAIALMDMHFADRAVEVMSAPAPVLTLVKPITTE